MADLSNDEILDLVKKHESGGLNVTNYMYDPTHTAQGYYQITNENWKKIAPQVGVDLQKYPNAMAAPEEHQRRVADYLLNNTPKGARNWESPAFRKAVGITDEEEGGPKVPVEAQNVVKKKEADPNDLSQLSDSDLDKQIAELQGQIKSKSDEAKKKEAGRSTLEKYATTPDIGNMPPLPPQMFPGADWVSNVTIPGIKQMIRGARGYKLPGQTDYSEAGKIYDVAAGGGKVIAPAGAFGFAAAPVTTMISALLGAGADVAGTKGASLFTDDPDKQKLTGLVTGAVAGGIPSLFRGRPSIPGSLEDLNVPTRAQGAFKAFGPSERRVQGFQEMFTGKPAKAGGLGGEARPSDLPKTPEMDDAVHFGNANEAQYKAYMKNKMGLTDDEAQTKWNNAKSRSDEIKAERYNEAVKERQAQEEKALKEQEARLEKRAKEQQTQQEKARKEAERQAEKAAKEAKERAADQGPMMQATPEMIRSSTNPAGPPSVTLPPGVTIKAPPPGPVGQPPTGTPIGQQLNPPPPMPVAPPPQNLGTSGQLIPQPPRPIGPIPQGTGMPPPPPEPPPIIPGTPGPQGLVNAPPSPASQGPVASGTPIPRQLTPDLPVAPPTSNVPSAPGLNLPVNLPGARPLPPVVPKMTPISTSLPGELEAMGIKIADFAEKSNRVVPRGTSKKTLAGWEKSMGLPEGSLTREQMNEGRRIYNQRVRARERRD